MYVLTLELLNSRKQHDIVVQCLKGVLQALPRGRSCCALLCNDSTSGSRFGCCCITSGLSSSVEEVRLALIAAAALSTPPSPILDCRSKPAGNLDWIRLLFKTLHMLA